MKHLARMVVGSIIVGGFVMATYVPVVLAYLFSAIAIYLVGTFILFLVYDA